MVSIFSTPIDPGFNKIRKAQEMAAPSVDVFTAQCSMSFEPPQASRDAKWMIEYFNNLEAHVANGTRCDNAIELILAEPDGAEA
jgi:hypothetical protein